MGYYNNRIQTYKYSGEKDRERDRKNKQYHINMQKSRQRFTPQNQSFHCSHHQSCHSSIWSASAVRPLPAKCSNSTSPAIPSTLSSLVDTRCIFRCFFGCIFGPLRRSFNQ